MLLIVTISNGKTDDYVDSAKELIGAGIPYTFS